ncbi:MAG: DegV family protein [Eubacteriales bacterium]|nr:DegV family protein [Eubacteriales bacterium]
MSYKIVVDSCCELPEELKKDPHFEIVPLGIEVGDYRIWDDENFNQKEFLEKVASCPECPKSSCPSPERYMNAYRTEAEHVYVVTLSANLSGSYNSAALGRNLYLETYGEKDICVLDSCSASCGETQLALLARELEEQGLPFETVVVKLEEFRSRMLTYFVLDNLETLRKNGRLTGVKALVASTLNIKPVMVGTRDGRIEQAGQGIGIKKALQKMADAVVKNVTEPEKRTLMITHCNNAARAENLRKLITDRIRVKDVLIMDTAGISSMYANDGGVIVTI